ncbi:hypothetical protein KCU85_g205, partial [Aureobasidium melanogenum]
LRIDQLLLTSKVIHILHFPSIHLLLLPLIIDWWKYWLMQRVELENLYREPRTSLMYITLAFKKLLSGPLFVEHRLASFGPNYRVLLSKSFRCIAYFALDSASEKLMQHNDYGTTSKMSQMGLTKGSASRSSKALISASASAAEAGSDENSGVLGFSGTPLIWAVAAEMRF